VGDERPADDGRTILPARSHRAPVPLSESIRRAVPPLAAVSAIVLVIVLLLVLNRPGNTTHAGVQGDQGPVVVPPTSTSASASASATASPSASSSAGTASPSPSASPHRTAPVAEPSATATPAAVTKLPVTVLNNSRRTGLAHEAAAQLSRGGWPIRQIGNFTGRIAVSTAYYAPGQQRAAYALAHQFQAIRRVLPRFSGLPGSGLTLVVTREWPA
jgi:hypothetical protein